MTDTGAKGGYNHAKCPKCDQDVVWSAAHDIDKMVRCDNEIKNPDSTGTKTCGHQMPRCDWEYLAARQRKE